MKKIKVQGWFLPHQGIISFCPPGQCPRNRVRCEIQERDLCMNSRDCPKKMKCCLFNCGKKCLDINKDVCTLPKVPGPCNAFFVRWWYDQEKETCSSFIYGGCQGNNNNFQSEECEETCKKPDFLIRSQPSLGPGLL
uniref:Eppin n=1 Tax=Moschus moschiferus TaxID=68415 RepID=A0A8C6FGU6_MOSMO